MSDDDVIEKKDRKFNSTTNLSEKIKLTIAVVAAIFIAIIVVAAIFIAIIGVNVGRCIVWRRM